MFESNLRTQSMDFAVQMINLVKSPKEKRECAYRFADESRCAQIKTGANKHKPHGFFGALILDAYVILIFSDYVSANHLLSWLEPGYRPDDSQTSAFSADMQEYIGFLPLQKKPDTLGCWGVRFLTQC